MDITRENYESWFLDWLEGKLTGKEEKEIKAFLQQNPDLANELEEWGETSVRPYPVTYRQKYGLKKPEILSINEAEWLDEQCIAYLEGDLEDEAFQKMGQLIKETPVAAQNMQAYRQVFLQAPDVAFPNKQRLYRHKGVRVVWHKKRGFFMRWAAAAAALIMLIGLAGVWWFPGPDNAVRKPAAYMRLQGPVLALEEPDILQRAELQPVRKERRPEPIPNNDTTRPAIHPLVEVSPEEVEVEADIIPLVKDKNGKGVNEGKHADNPYVDEVNKRIEQRLARIQKEPEGVKLGEFLERKILNDKVRQTSEKLEEDGLWAVAEWSVKGLNKITDKEIILNRKVNEKGKTTRIKLKASNFAIEKTMHHK